MEGHTDRSGRWRNSFIILFFLFPTQCADSSPPPGDKINQTRSSFLILSAELAPGAALPSSITAVELGKGEEPWLYPQLFLFREEYLDLS